METYFRKELMWGTYFETELKKMHDPIGSPQKLSGPSPEPDLVWQGLYTGMSAQKHFELGTDAEKCGVCTRIRQGRNTDVAGGLGRELKSIEMYIESAGHLHGRITF